MKERPFSFPLDKQIRVILDTDAYNEADDQYAIAHMLMTPRFDVKGIIAEQFGTAKCSDSEKASYDEICHIVDLMGLTGQVNILHGAPTALSDENTPIVSEGAQLIIDEAMKDDPRPLFVCNIGAITNLACALLLKPEIASRFTVLWIGGGVYPQGGFEYNFHNDLAAANVVMHSGAEIWQVPKNVYITMKVSYFELLNRVYPKGELGKYLVENTMRVAAIEAKMMEDHTTPLGRRYVTMSRQAASTSFAGEMWSLGDSPVVGLMLNSTCGRYHMESVPDRIRDDFTYDYSEHPRHSCSAEEMIENQVPYRYIRVYDDIDSHFILNDMFEKLEYYFG